MNRDELRALQAPLKQRYRESPDAATITLQAEGKLGDGIACRVDTGRALVEAGLHPGTGGSGLQLCSGDMLLQALVACAGVTLSAVATSMDITDASTDERSKLLELTERYCVVLQTLRTSPPVQVSHADNA